MIDKRKNGFRWYNLKPRQQYWFRGLWVDTDTTYNGWKELIQNINPDIDNEEVMLGMETHDITDIDYQKASRALIEIVNGRN